MQALAASHAPAARAKRLLDTPFPEHLPCIGQGLTAPDRWLDEQAPAAWRDDESWERPWQSCTGRWSSLWLPWGDQERGLAEEPSATPADRPAEPATDAHMFEGMPAPVVPPLAVGDTPVAVRPASRWFEQLGSLGAVAILSFAAAYRQGFRARS